MTLRELGSLCLVPLVLLGYSYTLRTPQHSSPNENGAIVELQTCETGVGAHIRATSSGLYASGLHYGFTGHVGNVSVTVQPRAGVSYVDHTNVNLPMRGQFELGAQMLVGYDRWRVAVDYWHLSNAGLQQPNTGMDMASVLFGATF